MKRTVATLLAVLFLVPVCALAEELTGKQIIEEQRKRHSVKSDIATTVMLLADKKGHKKKRLIRRYGKEFNDGLKRGLIVFMEPKDVAGTALLTWELPGGNSKQWVYLPGHKKMQRIATQSKKSYFMGTDFTYEDLQPDAIENYNYTLKSSDTLDGNPCYVVEILPATKEKQRESAYTKRVVWVRKDIFYALKLEFYGRRDRLIKTQTNHELVNLEGDVWMAKKALMHNNKTGHRTVMGIKSRQINVAIDDSVFTDRFILSGRHLH